MNTESRVAFIQSQSTAAMIEAMGMQAENIQRIKMGETVSYNEKDFTNLITKWGLEHNQVVAFLQG